MSDIPTVREIYRRRAQAAKTEGVLSATFRAAIVITDRLKAEGVPFAERVAFLAKALREAWPKGRDEAWKTLCQSCDDYGLVMYECPGDATCGRGKTHHPHTFGEPCWCSNGAKFRAKPKPTPDDFEAAGKVKHTLTRMGR